MASNFPTSLDNFTNPTSSNTLASPDHAGQHSDANDAIEALQAKVGVNSSIVTSTIDYKLAQLTGGTAGQALIKSSSTDYDVEWGLAATPPDDASLLIGVQVFS
jgi:hypothetical protein